MDTSEYLRTIRARIGSDLLLVGTAAAASITPAGDVLLTQRRDVGGWALPESIIEPGEDPADAAVRAAYQQSGVRVQPVRVSGVYGGAQLVYDTLTGDRVAAVCIVFVCQTRQGAANTGANVRCCPVDALPADVRPVTRRQIADALKTQTEAAFHYMPGVTPGSANLAPGYTRAIRSRIGQDLLQIVGAGAVVFNDAGAVLLMQRGDSGHWSTPTGKIEPGEEPAETVVREVYEETGVQVVAERLIGVYGGEELIYQYPRGDRVALIALIFQCRPVGGTPRADDRESIGAGYFAPDALPQPLSPVCPRRIADALAGSPQAAFRYRADKTGC